jgi:hypothetical protein
MTCSDILLDLLAQHPLLVTMLIATGSLLCAAVFAWLAWPRAIAEDVMQQIVGDAPRIAW